MNEKFTIGRREELETTAGKTALWRLIRRSLGVSSFGINEVEIAAGGRIPEHNEMDRDQEELFIILEGEPVMVIEGEEYPTRPGIYIRLDPEPKRYLRNDSKVVARILIISAPRSSGYKPIGWA